MIEVHARLGAERRRSLLQSGEERILRQRPLLPRDLRLHGAVRHQRRSEGLGALARGAHQGRSGEAEQQARLHHLRDGRPEHAHHARCSSTSATTPASTARASRRSAAWSPGMNVVDKLNAEYGEGAPRGRGPDQGRIQREGNAYLTKDFGQLDFVKKATIEQVDAARCGCGSDGGMRLAAVAAASVLLAMVAGCRRRPAPSRGRSRKGPLQHACVDMPRCHCAAAGKPPPLATRRDVRDGRMTVRLQLQARRRALRAPRITYHRRADVSEDERRASITARCSRRSSAARRCRCPRASAARSRAGRFPSVSTTTETNERQKLMASSRRHDDPRDHQGQGGDRDAARPRARPRRAHQGTGARGLLRRHRVPSRDRRLHGADRLPARHRHRRLRQEAQGRVQQGAARARHGVDGARAGSRIPATASSSSASTTRPSSTTSTPSGAR